MKTVLFRSHHIAALVLSYLYLPLPGGGGGQSIDVNVDLVTLSGGGDEHVLASIVATNGWRNRASRVRDGQSVVNAVSNSQADYIVCASYSCWSSEDHRIEVYPQFADICVGGAESVSAGILVRTGGVGGDHSVGVVGTAAAATSDGEDTANSEGRSTGSGGCSSKGAAF